mmetsp:Transcript_19388/g.32412  ORF Transcript_19388/g.32412 Transcript_19388/m.32412 type:complete len:568 (+) Transcript_19388:80-1783(+)
MADGWQNNDPDMIIGKRNKMKGDIKFDGILRVEGTIDGRIIAPRESRIVVSPGGCFIGDLSGLVAAYIDGKVIGDVNVEELYLGSSAAVHGDVTCKSLQIDGGASIVGQLQVSPKAPVNSEYDENRSIVDLEKDDEDGGFPLDDDEQDRANNPAEEDREEGDAEETNESPPKPSVAPPEQQQKRDYKVILFVMEPQIDFYPGGSCWESAKVTSAEIKEEEMKMMRLSDFITSHMDEIDEIVISLDSHNRINIAHCAYWTDKQGVSPEVGTLISMQDIQTGRWKPRKDESIDYVIAILQQLDANKQLYGRRSFDNNSNNNNNNNSSSSSNHSGGIVIKPDYCVIGSRGASIVPALHDAVGAWGAHTLRNVTYVTRGQQQHHLGNNGFHNSGSNNSGSNSNGDHHAADSANGYENAMDAFARASADDKALLAAAKGDIAAAPEYYDLSFLRLLDEDDKLLVCGQTHSHSVEFSANDVLKSAATTAAIHPSNIIILRDATSTTGLQAEWEQAQLLKQQQQNQSGKGESKGAVDGNEEDGSTDTSSALIDAFWTTLQNTGVQIATTSEARL